MSAAEVDQARRFAACAASAGCDIRFRANGDVTSSMAALAVETGCVSLVGSVSEEFIAESPCVQIVPGSALLRQHCSSRAVLRGSRRCAALATGYERGATTSMNSQYLLFPACRDAGLKIEEAITAATHNAACALGLCREVGSLMPGKSADVCIMDVGDYRELAERPGHHDVWMVLCAGRVVYRRAAPLMR